MAHPFTRRDFVRTAAASTAAITAFGAAAPAVRAQPAIVAAPRPRGTRANDRMQLAFIGFGVRARELHGGFLDDDGIEIVAVADVVAARAQEGVRLINERRKNGACKVAGSWREILANPAIDAVIIATPDHWHAEPAIAAALAGKHVYCEKPLSLTIAEGRAIANAARATQIRFQTGSQQRSEFGYHFVRAAEAVRNGRIGKVTRVTIGVGAPPVPCDLPEQPLPEGIDWDGWLGQAPFRPFNAELCPIGMHGHYPKWRNYREYCNGGLADMGAHHFDIAQWALAMDESGPREVIPPADGAKTGLRFVYASGTEMVHGGHTDCTFYGTEGTIECSRGHVRAYRGEDPKAADDATLLEPPHGGEIPLPRNASHIDDFLRAIREGRDPICTAETGHRTATICQLCNIGYEIGKPLAWNPAAERFTGAHAAEANALTTRAVRRHA
ncbi:MAG: Gfo/Idh/MocA family protein [Phycisphaerales bacterium]